MRRRITAWLLMAAVFLGMFAVTDRAWAAQTEKEESGDVQEESALMEAPSGVLMEASTGKVLYEKEKDAVRSPASITKIMTLLLIFDALEEGKLSMEDPVTTSAYAKSMGGSQVYLEEGEIQTVETMIKCIVIASGNDASVAMAEHLAGSEEAFVQRMNERARELGMEHTHFEDCCGLTDSKNHYTTAGDVALMSRELICRYPEILEYSSIWMDTITHETRQGTSEFGLTNTNKLVRSYEGCVGLKTGSTSLAKYCVSAVARRNGMTLIAVVMGAENYKIRFSDAAALLNYGFARCSLYQEENPEQEFSVDLRRGKEDQVSGVYEEPFVYVDTSGKSLDQVTKKTTLSDQVTAPVRKGETLGRTVYYLEGKAIGEAAIVAAQDVPKAQYPDCLEEVWKVWCSARAL